MEIPQSVIFLVLVIINLIKFGDSNQILRLQPMHIKNSKITLSGFSSGGTFAQQLQFSYSSLFSGIAVFSHTYYRCGTPNGDVDNYDKYCTKLGNLTIDQLYDPQNAINDIEKYRKEKLIENPRNLKNKKLYVYAGLSNFLFSADMSMRILKIYEPFIDNPAHIKTRVQDAALLLPSDTFGGKCSENAQANFFIGNCGFSGALDALQFLLDSPDTSIRKPGRNVKLEQLRTFDQREFFTKERHDMDDWGFIYIPKGCHFRGIRNSPATNRGIHPHGCHLHVYFHGCLTERTRIGDSHVRNSGYLEVAEENKIIMLFPNAVKSDDNDIGCWDTYGFTGPLHGTQKGAQVTVVNKMIRRIIGDWGVSSGSGFEKQEATTTGYGWNFGRLPEIKFPDRRQ